MDFDKVLNKPGRRFKNSKQRQPKQPDAIGFLKDEITDKDEFHFLNFSKFADHIVWRVSHFIDDAKLARGRSFNDFQDYLHQTGLKVSVQEAREADGTTRKALYFSDVDGPGFTLKDSQICDQLKLENLAKHITDIAESGSMSSFSQSLVVPETESAERPTWFYAPSPNVRAKQDKVIAAAMSAEGLYGTFKPTGLGDADPYRSPLGTKLVARVKKTEGGRTVWADEPYSKTMTPVPGSSNMFTVESNSAASTMKYQTVGAASLEDFVERIYGDGSYTIHGKAVFADRPFFARRIKLAKERKVLKGGGPGYNDFLPWDVQKAFLNTYLPKKYGSHAQSQKSLLERAEFTTIEMGNILPQLRTVMAIDIDNLNIPEDRQGEIDFINNQQESIQWLRELLPEAMQDAKMVLMLSSSYGMAKDNGVRTFLGKAGTSISLRVWVQANKPIDAENFKHLIRNHQVEMSADNTLYSHNQPIYGAPKFEGCKDPLEGKRTIIVPGHETFDVDLLAEEAADLDTEEVQMPRRPLSERARVDGAQTGSSSARGPVKKYSVNPEDSVLDQSRARTLDKLQSLGDREGMFEHTGHRDHFGFLRRTAQAHLHVLFDLYPASKPIYQADLFNGDRDDYLIEEVDFLQDAIIKSFFEALEDPDRITTMSDLREYGVGDQGLIPHGKTAQLLVDSCVFISKLKEKDRRGLIEKIAAAAKNNMPLDEEVAKRYLEKYTMPTGVNKNAFALRADAFKGWPVLINPEGLFVDFPKTNDLSSKIATYEGTDRYFWAPVVSNDKIPNSWQEGELADIFQKLANLDAPQNMVFCHNCELSDIEHLLPKPTSSRPRPRLRMNRNLGKQKEKPTPPPPDKPKGPKKVVRRISF